MIRRKISKSVKKKLEAGVRQSRRDTVYKFLMLENGGDTVPCFVCGRHVREKNATLEHIEPVSLGGTGDIMNLSISHYQCNLARGNDIGFTRKDIPEIVQDLDDRINFIKIIL
jgi:hypothetical protein